MSTIDISPTLFDLADCAPQLTQHGESLAPLMRGENAPRECARAEWELLPTRAGVALSLQVVRTETHKLTVDEISGAGEMYDLVNDPHELKNIFEDDRYIEVRKELEAMIAMRPDDKMPIQTQVGAA